MVENDPNRINGLGNKQTNNKKQKTHTLHWQFLRPVGQRSDGR